MSKQIPSANPKCALRCCALPQHPAVYGWPSSLAYRWPQQLSVWRHSYLCLRHPCSTMPCRPEGNVLYKRTNKQRPCHLFGYGPSFEQQASPDSQRASLTACFHLQLCLAKDITTRPGKLALVHFKAHQVLDTQRVKVNNVSGFPTACVLPLSNMWTRRTPSILHHRHLKLQTTPRLFIQALKRGSGSSTSLHYSVRLLTHKASLTAAVQCPCNECESKEF